MRFCSDSNSVRLDQKETSLGDQIKAPMQSVFSEQGRDKLIIFIWFEVAWLKDHRGRVRGMEKSDSKQVYVKKRQGLVLSKICLQLSASYFFFLLLKIKWALLFFHNRYKKHSSVMMLSTLTTLTSLYLSLPLYTFFDFFFLSILFGELLGGNFC